MVSGEVGAVGNSDCEGVIEAAEVVKAARVMAESARMVAVAARMVAEAARMVASGSVLSVLEKSSLHFEG